MYGFDENVDKSNINLMAPGINENVELVSVAYEPAKKDGTGNKVLRFTFKNEAGAEFNHIEWEINDALE